MDPKTRLVTQEDLDQKVRMHHVLTSEEASAIVAAVDAPTQHWKVRPKHGGPWLIVPPSGLGDALDESDDGNEYEVVSVWMSKAEYEALGDFNGW